MIRYIKILLALTVALWGLLGGMGNLSHYDEGMNTVAAVVSMETLPEGTLTKAPGAPNRLLVILGFAFIWSLKLVGGVLCLVGAYRMWAARKADQEEFVHAKRWAIAGCAMLFFMLFFGFSLVAVGPFRLYLSPMVSAVQLAAVFAAQIGLVMVFLHQKESSL